MYVIQKNKETKLHNFILNHTISLNLDADYELLVIVMIFFPRN